MKPTQKIASIITLFFLLPCGMSNSATAAEVDARLSTHDAWVGMPVVLQLSIHNAANYEQPTIPEIDGCDIRSAGAPSQSTQTTIINGRRSNSHSIVMQYLVTPRREGTYEIPPLVIKVDGRIVTTDRLRFVATKSETGNLLFVEIEGGKDSVFVGQPLELTLKIWVKPYRDPEKRIILSEENMWQLISQHTSWGSFLDRMKELAANNQRPGGKEVLRDDGQGNERSYYLYNINATVYPKRPGKIDADDVQIVVNYPTELGKARDPFEDFFGNSPFGGRSPLSQMMDDDFFASPFSNRLTVSSSRPIVAEAKVDATEVLPVPAEGRPADYRGAVGRYEIITQATPIAVNAGDPITLNIGISGTGPMELVQAPPLSELQSLTDDFKVSDQSLAGYVQDTTKLFSTTIRPRREGITQIPPIPLSFFDPESGKYVTVMSDPIAIAVEKSESLSLDAIVGKQRRADEGPGDAGLVSRKPGPDFTNSHTPAVLLSQSPAASNDWWWYIVFAPPVVWLITLLFVNRASIGRRLPGLRSAKARCQTAISSAEQSSQIVTALTHYIASRSRRPCTSSDAAVGVLRTVGIVPAAIDVEAFFQRCEQSPINGSSQQPLSDLQQEARELFERIASAFTATNRSLIRRSKRTAISRTTKPKGINSAAQRLSILILATLVASSVSSVTADEVPFNTADGNASIADEQNQTEGIFKLSTVQQRTLLTESAELYSRATDIAKTDSAEAKELFTSAAGKYQLLVVSGVQNALLYRNLGNACLQSNQLGRAIANYERARLLDPNDRQLAVNLEFANSLVKGQLSTNENATAKTAGDVFSFPSLLEKLREINRFLTDIAGMRLINWTVVVSSLLFWSLLIVHAAGYRFPVKRFAIILFLPLITSLTSAVLASSQPPVNETGIIVTNTITLRSGDGELFDTVLSLDATQGHRVQILTVRGDWTQVKTTSGEIGWLPAQDVERFSTAF